MGSPGNLATAARTGLSEPISTGSPGESYVIKTRELEKFLADAGLYESHEEAIKREEVLGRLDQTVKLWVKNISCARGYNEAMIHEVNAKVFMFGSYRLGIHKLLLNFGPEIPELSPASDASSGSLAMEKPVIELSSSLILGHLSALEIPDGMIETLDNGDSKIIKPLESSTEEEKAPEAATVGNGADSCSKIQPYRDLEELEPLELPVTTLLPSNSANVQTQKPVIRFSFTSLGKATGNSA